MGDSANHPSALDYIVNRMDDVTGFFTPLDAGMFAALDFAQKGAGIAGDMAEIGVLHGRSAFLLAHLLNEGERIHAIDIFDMYWPNTPYNLPDALIGNALKLGMDLTRFNLIKADTTKEADRVVSELGAGTARFFHVDGDHRLVNIMADSKIALQVTRSDGVIAFDDVFSYLMPEVTEGIIRSFLGRTDFVPLALSSNKAYFCPPHLKSRYAAYIIECLPNNLDQEVRRFLDHWVLTFTAERPVVLRYFDKIGAGPEQDLSLHRHILGREANFPLPP